MATTFTANKSLSLQGTGDNAGTWGGILNTNVFTLIDQCLGSFATVSLASANVTLSTANIQNMGIVFTGTLTANITVTLPAVGGEFLFTNATTGNFTVTIASAGGGASTVIVPRNYITKLYTDGVNVFNDTAIRGAFTSVATGTTVDIGTVPNGLVLVNGTGSAITSFGSTAQADSPIFMVMFNGPNTVLNASIPNPSGIDLSVASGDILYVIRTGPGAYRIFGADLASGLPITQTPSTQVPKTQCALYGPANSFGEATYISTAAAGTAQTSGLTSTPLLLTATNGYNSNGIVNVVVRLNTNLSWTGLAFGTTAVPARNFLGYNLTTGTAFSTTLQPVYAWGGAISVTNNQYTYDISAAIMYKGNGTAAVPVVAVFLGELWQNASIATLAMSYAYQGKWQWTSDSRGVFPVPSSGGGGAGGSDGTTNTPFIHNLGVGSGGMNYGVRCSIEGYIRVQGLGGWNNNDRLPIWNYSVANVGAVGQMAQMYFDFQGRYSWLMGGNLSPFQVLLNTGGVPFGWTFGQVGYLIFLERVW